MPDVDLSQIPTFKLLAELASRCVPWDRQVTGQQPLPGTTRAVEQFPDLLNPAQAVPMFLGRREEEPEREREDPYAWPPKNSKVQVIPGQFKKDGQPRRLISPTDPLITRLNPLNDTRSEAEAGMPGATRYILHGAEREAMAQSFIDQWQSEIREARAQLEIVKDPDVRDQLEALIRRLEAQIRTRASSAFGAMTLDEVKEANRQTSGGVMDAQALPGSKETAQAVVVVTGIPEYDYPPTMIFKPVTPKEVLDPLVRALAVDSHRDPAGLRVPRWDGSNIVVPTDPVLMWRLIVVTKKVFQALGGANKTKALDFWAGAEAFQREVYDGIYNDKLWTSFEPPFLKAQNAAEDYRQRMLGHLGQALAYNHPTEAQARGIKRMARIFDVDFKEMEIPDEWYEQTDGENPLGRQLRPRVDVRSPWKVDQ